MNKRKIINDPVFGFIYIPNDFLYDCIQHRYFQRLNRIKQLGLSSFVYPGAQHTRFLHSLGAMHLTHEAIHELRAKGETISEEEESGVLAAVLLHDIGHGPFSHVSETFLTPGVNHEHFTLLLMEDMNREMEGALTTAIDIFTDRYPKRFLHQLVSGQLDMDRLDYLRRDAFFTGVTEGVIGSARIIKMLRVLNDRLVVEEKGIYSIENFLIARRFMYWQVYLHKSSTAAELLLQQILRRAKYLVNQGLDIYASPALHFFLELEEPIKKSQVNGEFLNHYISLDDSDIYCAVKVWMSHSDKILSLLSKSFIERKLYKVVKPDDIDDNYRRKLRLGYCAKWGLSEQECSYFMREETVTSRTYNPNASNIMILSNDGKLTDIAKASDILQIELLQHREQKRYFFYYHI